jgi:hypothetical protein
MPEFAGKRFIIAARSEIKNTDSTRGLKRLVLVW